MGEPGDPTQRIAPMYPERGGRYGDVADDDKGP